jgi:hypothetical protein
MRLEKVLSVLVALYKKYVEILCYIGPLSKCNFQM